MQATRIKARANQCENCTSSAGSGSALNLLYSGAARPEIFSTFS